MLTRVRGVQYLDERSRVVDYVSDVAGKLGLMDETVHSGMELVDRVSSRVGVRGKDLVLAAVACLVVAAKYSELTQDERGIYTPSYSLVLAAMDNPQGLAVRTLAAWEMHVLQVLDWRLSTATPLDFITAYRAKCGRDVLCAHASSLRQDSRVLHDQAKQVWQFVWFFCNLATQSGISCIFGASASAAAAIVAARTVTNINPPWPQGLAQCLKVEAHAQIEDCRRAILRYNHAEYPEHAHKSRATTASPTNIDIAVTITTSATQTPIPPSDKQIGALIVPLQSPAAAPLHTSAASPAVDENPESTTGHKRKREDAVPSDEQPKPIRR